MATHKEALRLALVAYWGEMFGPHVPDDFINTDDMEAAIRAYLDAMDAVIVPKSATIMMEASAVAGTKPYHDLNWFQCMPKDFFRLAWPHLLAAAPDPFKDEDNDR